MLKQGTFTTKAPYIYQLIKKYKKFLLKFIQKYDLILKVVGRKSLIAIQNLIKRENFDEIWRDFYRKFE